MIDNTESRNSAKALRRKAEEKVASQPSPNGENDAMRLMHELQVHQVELEMQNEELSQKLAELNENRMHLINIIKETPAGYFHLDPEGYFLGVNDAWLRMHGYSFADEVIGQHFSMVQVDSSSAALALLAELKRGVPVPSGEFTYLRKDGSVGYFIFSAHPVARVDTIVGFEWFITDITERIRAEKALVKSRGMLEEAESLGKVGGWEFNIDTGKQTWTKGVYDIHEVDYGYKPTLNKGIDFYTQESKPIIAAAIKQAVEQDKPFDVELEIKTAKGNHCRVHAIGKTDLVNRRVHGFFQDITERKSNELALLAATQATDAASRAKGLFLAKMSHELRTPMTAIIGFGELLEDADLTPEHKRHLAAINTSGKTLSSLIDDVLDLSKVDAGELAVKPKEFRLQKLITKLVTTQEQQVAKKNLSLNISIDSDVPDSLIGDPQRIQQVLLNLLGNAIKFTEKGDIGIAVSVVEENNLRVLLNIAVRDTGIGISADRLEHIFEPFAQSLGSSHDNYGGSGLGLTICRSLAGLMGGTVSVESQEGIGSIFYLLLPLQKKNDNLSEKSLPEKEASLWCGPVLNILLAEDNPINSHFIKTVLKDMGHAVSVAENGKVALDTLKVNTFDLVLMDIQMPVMSGSDVLSVIREMEQLSGKHLTVIALTAYALIGDKEKYLGMGFDGYLSKPFKTAELMGEMARVVLS